MFYAKFEANECVFGLVLRLTSMNLAEFKSNECVLSRV